MPLLYPCNRSVTTPGRHLANSRCSHFLLDRSSRLCLLVWICITSRAVARSPQVHHRFFSNDTRHRPYRRLFFARRLSLFLPGSTDPPSSSKSAATNTVAFFFQPSYPRSAARHREHNQGKCRCSSFSAVDARDATGAFNVASLLCITSRIVAVLFSFRHRPPSILLDKRRPTPSCNSCGHLFPFCPRHRRCFPSTDLPMQIPHPPLSPILHSSNTADHRRTRWTPPRSGSAALSLSLSRLSSLSLPADAHP